MNLILETERLIMREMRHEDAEALFYSRHRMLKINFR